MSDFSFPKGFVWGTATAAVQIEGYSTADGGGENVWDVECRKPGKIAHGDTMAVACDHYHRYKEDVEIMRELGVTGYRFSMSWPRILPEGDGKINQGGLDFYSRLIDELLNAGITPYVTLYHWDLPAALQRKYDGWLSRRIPELFGEYAAIAAKNFSDRVQNFITVNEIECFTNASYNTQGGRTAPSRMCTRQQEEQVVFHGCLAHGLAMQALRANAKGAIRVGIAQNASTPVPVMETDEHIAAAKKAFRYMNRSMLTMIMEGKYPEEYLNETGEFAPVYTEEDLKTISAPMDFLGLNLYTAQYVIAAPDDPKGWKVIPYPALYPKMNINWEYIVPETLYWAARFSNEYWHPKEIFFTENGASATDQAQGEQIMDTDRISYLRSYLSGLLRAAQENIPVRGYFLWSLMDNFEWNNGYDARFGLVHVDWKTLKRTPKMSYDYYKQIIKNNKLI